MKNIEPFEKCPALDGYHCQTNSLAKIYHFYGCPLSEDMLLGLGAGMGFIYWQMKGNKKLNIPDFIFIGGRGNTKNFFEDLGKRTGVVIRQYSTSSQKKAEQTLLETLRKKQPMMVYADMGFLPWFELPKDYHFGRHTFVVCGYDGKETVLASDIDQNASGRKKGFYSQITLEQLRKARGSIHKPFPPKNAYLEFDFRRFHHPTKKDIFSSITQTIETMLHPPISNIGVAGMKKTSTMLRKWPDMFSDYDLRMNLFSLYIFIEIGGTGGGCFRYMYSRFLEESSKISESKELKDAAEKINESGKLFSEIGMLFKNAETDPGLKDKIKIACEKFEKIADIEEETFNSLKSIVK